MKPDVVLGGGHFEDGQLFNRQLADLDITPKLVSLIAADVTMDVAAGELLAIVGPNGAGKSTLLWTILGAVEPRGGTITFDERDVTRLPTHAKVDLGITLVPEGKHLFGEMTVHDNLVMGAYRKEAQKKVGESLDLVYSLFPVLAERRLQLAGSLSGGEQQMVTIGRALMPRPRLLMLDEPSQGLAPKLVLEVFETIGRLKRQMSRYLRGLE